MADFERLAFLDEPSIAGAQWWQKSVQGELSRRTTLVALGLGAAVLTVGVGACIKAIANDEETTEGRAALEMQRRYGWSFGANGEPLLLAGLTAAADVLGGAAQRDRLTRLALEPTDPALKPFYQAALVEVPSAKATEHPTADESIMQPFVEAFVPVQDSGLSAPFRVGLALARIFAELPERCALVIDLTGASSVAVAAGAAEQFSPVLVMPNWPHPRGVVRSHQALASLAIFHGYFDESAPLRREGAPPAFVLDADRTLPVLSAEQSFDNRYRAAVPPAAKLKELGIQHVFVLRELEAVADDAKDLAARFTEWTAAGIPVHMLFASDFFLRQGDGAKPEGQRSLPYLTLGDPPFAFGGTTNELAAFRATYLGGPGTPYGRGNTWKPKPPDPKEASVAVGMVPVVIVGGIVLGAQMARQRDSWSRGFGGGGG